MLDRLTRTTALAVLPLLLLTACGGGSGKKSTVSSGLAKADYLTRSEAICTKANADLDALPEPATPADLPANLTAGLTIATKATADLAALGAAQPDKAQLSTIFLTPLQNQLTVLTAYIPKVTEAAAKGADAVSTLPEPDLPKADLAAMRTYGFKDCVDTADTTK